jgi:uncharacterized protein YndB with AHSA1/START domain
LSTPNPTSTTVLRITRTFAASRERVFDAFTRPELLRQWWGPAGFTLPQAEVDLRVGGAYRFAMRPPQGEVMYLGGVFKEVERPSRLSYTWVWEAMPEAQTLVTIDFNEAEGDTEVVLTQEPFKDANDVALHDQGWRGGLDKLERILRRKTDGKA